MDEKHIHTTTIRVGSIVIVTRSTRVWMTPDLIRTTFMARSCFAIVLSVGTASYYGDFAGHLAMVYCNSCACYVRKADLICY